MKSTSLEKQIENVASLLMEFFPKKTYLYFPLISAAISWAADRAQNWKERIFSYQVWPDPGIIEEKPDKYVYGFFKGHPGLKEFYAEELEAGDKKKLRTAFTRLYPVIGLEDPFLSALFLHELEAGDYETIVKEFNGRVIQAREDIKSLKRKPRFLKGLEDLAAAVISLGTGMLSDKDVQEMIAEIVKEKIKDKDE